MKKIISVFLVLSILFLFSGCGPNADLTEENVKATVETATEALKTFDTDQLDKYVDSKTLSYIVRFAKDHEQFAKLGRAIFENLTVEVQAVDLDNKTVTVNVSNKDLYQVAADFAQDLLSKYSTFQLLGKLSNDGWLDTNLQKLTDGIGGASMQDGVLTATLSIRQEKKNLVLAFDEEAENAVSGGALGAVKSLVG